MSGRGVSDKICGKGAETLRGKCRRRGLGGCPAADELWAGCRGTLGTGGGEPWSRIISTALGERNRIACQAASRAIHKYPYIYMRIYCLK